MGHWAPPHLNFNNLKDIIIEYWTCTVSRIKSGNVITVSYQLTSSSGVVSGWTSGRAWGSAHLSDPVEVIGTNHLRVATHVGGEISNWRLTGFSK